jgi:hypothetical protein
MLDLALSASVLTTALYVPEARKDLFLASLCYVGHRAANCFHSVHGSNQLTTLADIVFCGTGIATFQHLETFHLPAYTSWPMYWMSLVFTGTKLVFYARCFGLPFANELIRDVLGTRINTVDHPHTL